MVSSPENTKDPLSMEYRITPTEKTSTFELYLVLVNISGATNPGVADCVNLEI
jgi:hypothetical protein